MPVQGGCDRLSPLNPKRHFIDYHLATISGKIRMVESAIVDGKTAQPNWNSLKSLRIALCLSGARRIPPSPPFSLGCRESWPRSSQNRWKSAQFRNFFPQIGPEKMSDCISRASFRGFFSEGHCGSPVSSTPPGEWNAITNRWFGESPLTLPIFATSLRKQRIECWTRVAELCQLSLLRLRFFTSHHESECQSCQRTCDCVSRRRSL